MSQDFLSQDEVDDLLKGVSGEADEPRVVEESGGARSYDFAHQERIVRGRMPTLEMINERFARLFRIGLFNLVRRTADVAVSPVRVVKYSEFVRNLVVPTNLNLVQAKPLRGTGLIVFDPNLVFLIVDSMFGGDGRYHTRVEGRDFSQTEQRIIQRMLEVLFADYEKSWNPVCAIKFSYVRSEMNTQFATIATPNEVVVVSTFTVELGAGGGDIHVCMPYSMIEPIREALYSSVQGDHMEADKRWVKLLSRQVQDAEVELVANLGQVTLPIGRVLGMKVGDVVTIDVSESISAEVDSVPVMRCEFGVSNGQYALKVKQMIGSSYETGEGESHA